MDGSYYFSQGRLISANTIERPYPYSKYVDKDVETNTDKENKDKNDWMKIFNGYKFQIFSPSILRYK